MKGGCVVFYCALVAFAGVSAQGPCLAGWTYSPDTGSCYHVARDPEPWGEAMKMCEIHDSKLIHIESQAEQTFTEQLLKPQAGQNNFYWLGGSDWSKQGSWVWEPDGEAITYTNWAPHEPDNGGSDQLVGQDCMVMVINDGYRWHDHKCDPHKYFYICEKRP